MQVLEKLNVKINLTEKVNKFGVIILKVNPMKNSFNGKILGRSLSDWVAFACDKLPIKFVEFDGKENILNIARNNLNDNVDYSIILLSTTPLIENGVIKEIIDYCSYKQVNLCKLPVGYVVNNQYLMDTDNPSVDSLFSQHLDNFYVVENKKQYAYALSVLQNKINSFHIENGVDIIDPQSVYIEPEVDIDKGVEIYSRNTLKGQTKITSGVILKENNVIENSKLGKNSCISGSVINGSIVGANVYISSFCEINNGLIDDDCTISSGCKINNYRLEKNSKVKANTVLGDEDDSNRGTR